MKSLSTQILINAPADRVWGILTDFEAYPEWNPFIREFRGTINEGSRFSVTIHPPGGKAMKFRPRCLTLKPNREFRWQGHLFVKGLFDGEHIFELESLEDGSTRFTQRENFRGLLVPLIWRSIAASTENGFNEMNIALKARAEAV